MGKAAENAAALAIDTKQKRLWQSSPTRIAPDETDIMCGWMQVSPSLSGAAL